MGNVGIFPTHLKKWRSCRQISFKGSKKKKHSRPKQKKNSIVTQAHFSHLWNPRRTFLPTLSPMKNLPASISNTMRDSPNLITSPFFLSYLHQGHSRRKSCNG